MTIEQLDTCKVLISLGSEDMENFALKFENLSFCSEHSKRILLRLLQLACIKAGISAKSKSVLMEALPLKSGCLILVTMTQESPVKSYRVKGVSVQPCFVFDSVEEMFSAAEQLYRQQLTLHSNSLWLSEGRYFIISESPLLKKKAREILTQYGTQHRCTQVQLSRIKERGKLLKSGDAAEYIGRKLSRQNSEDFI